MKVHTQFNRPATKECSETELSFPDISLYGTAWESIISWFAMEQIGYSDHLPSAICINEWTKMGSVYKDQSRWKSLGVGWKVYTETIENSVWNSGKS